MRILLMMLQQVTVYLRLYAIKLGLKNHGKKCYWYMKVKSRVTGRKLLF